MWRWVRAETKKKEDRRQLTREEQTETRTENGRLERRQEVDKRTRRKENGKNKKIRRYESQVVIPNLVADGKTVAQ